MTTKEDEPFLKKKPIENRSDGQFFNFNLNQIQKCSDYVVLPFQSSCFSKSNSNKSFDYTVAEKYQERRKSTKNLCFKTSKNPYSNFENKQETRLQKRWMKHEKDISDLNQSTLSLHIAAYEMLNKSQTLVKKSVALKFVDSLPKIQTYQDFFEFPRQMECIEQTSANTPEIMQFKTSQKLVSPNQDPLPSSSSNQMQEFTPVSEASHEKKIGKCRRFWCCCPNFPGRIFAWLIAFFVWYEILVGVHLGLVSEMSPFLHGGIILFWNGIFLLTISSLLSAALTEPAEIDSKYKVPEELFEDPEDNPRECKEMTFHRRLSKYASEHPELSFQLVDVGDFLYPRYCNHCRIFKPLRAHHCRTCEKCIPRMDHHCPVLGTCVHHHNHKFFLLFLFWASMLCLTAIAVIGPSVADLIGFAGRPLQVVLVELIPAMIVTSGLTNALVCGFALLGFQSYLWWMLKNNVTTLESHEDDDDGDAESYDLGTSRKNIQSIFGDRWYLWFLPVPTTPGDGCTFVQKIRQNENSIED